MRIRRLDHAERVTISVPTQAYCFQPSPATESVLANLRDNEEYYADNITLVAEDGGAAVAQVSAIPMRQNVRGSVFPMAGIAGVASQPHVRRRGHVRALFIELLGQARESGCVISTLYPFRPSFYEKFGYVGVPKTRTVRVHPGDLAPFLRTELAGDVVWESIRSGFDTYRDFTHGLLPRRHGFAVLPAHREARIRDAERWLVTAMVNGEVVGAVTYQITGYGGELLADDLLVTNAFGRALVLQFLARHADHVTKIVMTVPPDEVPESWTTDLTMVVETRTAFPTSPAPMVRVLSLDALRGISVGAGRVAVEIVDDPFVTGQYTLDGTSGTLEITPGTSGSPVARLTVPGLSGLIYGVLDPGEVVVRGFGDVPAELMPELSTLFPRRLPYLYSRF